MDDATDSLFAAIAAGYAVTDDDGIADIVVRIRAAMDAGANWREPRVNGEDAAFAAVFAVRPEVLATLLDAGVPATHSSNGTTLLHRAADRGRVGTVQLLVARGVAPDVRDAAGMTPLDVARQCSHCGGTAVRPLLELMVAHGCTPSPAPARAHRGIDLHAARVREVFNEALSSTSPAVAAVLRHELEVLFVQCSGYGSDDLLRGIARVDHALLPATILLVKRASTATPTTKTVSAAAAKKTGGRNPFELAHHGDVVFDTDIRVKQLIVTGSVRSAGRLRLVVGAVVVVGEALDVEGIDVDGEAVVVVAGRDLKSVGAVTRS